MQVIGLPGKRAATMMEVALIAAVLVCLPLFEAPKNAFSVCFLTLWGARAVLGSGVGSSSPFDLPIAALAAILWIAPIFSDFGATITPINSAPRWTLLALFVLAVSRLDYSRKQVAIIVSALIFGGVAAVVESFWAWSLNDRQYPEFRSVGHVNHSSMYSLVTFAVGIGSLYMRERWVQALGVAAIISTFAFLSPSKSIVGGVAVTAILLMGVVVWGVRLGSFRSFAIALCAIAITAASAIATPPAAGFREELVARLTSDDIFSQRDKILNSALVVWDRHPLIGTGWHSFGEVTSEQQVRSALFEDGLEYDPAVYAHHAHGHNLWTTMLIERGLLGVLLISALLIRYFGTFLPLALSRKQTDQGDYGVVLAALLVALGFAVAGLGNTTMMNEHGHAGMSLIAVSYGYIRGKGLPTNDASA